MSTGLIILHVVFVSLCASVSFAWGWVTGIRAHRDYIEEERGRDHL